LALGCAQCPRAPILGVDDDADRNAIPNGASATSAASAATDGDNDDSGDGGGGGALY